MCFRLSAVASAFGGRDHEGSFLTCLIHLCSQTHDGTEQRSVHFFALDMWIPMDGGIGQKIVRLAVGRAPVHRDMDTRSC